MGPVFLPWETSLRSSVCSSCLRTLRHRKAPRKSQRVPLGPSQLSSTLRYLHSSADGQCSPDGGSVKQLYPLKGYYSDILRAPTQTYSHSRRPQIQPQTAEPLPSEVHKEQSPQEKFGIVFGTRLAGPGYSSSRYNPTTNPPKATWQTINGVPIPPRPAEPENCCMSGCVHCVWDDYRDDVEAWAQRINEAKKRDAPRKGSRKKKLVSPLHDMRQTPRKEVASASLSMDDDGGGSQGIWDAEVSADSLFADIPVGIREFMKTEKKLREKRKAVEGT